MVALINKWSCIVSSTSTASHVYMYVWMRVCVRMSGVCGCVGGEGVIFYYAYFQNSFFLSGTCICF